MNSKSSKGKKSHNTKAEDQEAQWTDLANNKAIEQEDKGESEEEEEEFEVELIFDKMIKKGTVFYKVKWKNYSLEEATWEPEANLDNAPLKIREFENQLLANKAKEKVPEAPKETIPKPEIKKEEIKEEEDQDEQNKKGTKKVSNNKLPAVVQASEPESVTGKRDRQTLEDEKPKSEEKTAKPKKEKSGKKKTDENHDNKQQPTDKKSINKADQEKSQPDNNEEEVISKMRKLSPKSSGQSQAQIIPMQDSTKSIIGSTDKSNIYPPSVKYTPKDAPPQSSAEKEQIEKIYDELFEKAKQSQGQPSSGKINLPDQIFLSQSKSHNIMIEGQEPKNNPSNKAQQLQESNKGISLSKIMQDDKLMEMSETESLNRSEMQESDKREQGSEAGAASKAKKKGRSEYGALEKGDIPLKVVGIRPVKEDKDLEIMISWKTREDGVKPYNSKVMRIDLLKSGFYMPLIEFYESKMKLEGAPSFDPGMLPKV